MMLAVRRDFIYSPSLACPLSAHHLFIIPPIILFLRILLILLIPHCLLLPHSISKQTDRIL